MKKVYSTKLISRSTSFIYPIGIVFILFGLISIILSSIDLSNQYSIIYYSSTNDNKIISQFISTSNTEQSIWPTLAKGIWSGLFFIAIGIYSLISYKEKTLISLRILVFIAFISIFISLFLFLSSIIVFQRYIIQGKIYSNQRTSIEQQEIIINALLFVCGVLSFIISLILTIGTFIAANFCQPKSDDQDNIDIAQQKSPPPSYYG